jgi:hypothetical protein
LARASCLICLGNEKLCRESYASRKSEKLKESVVVLKLETEKLEAKLVAAELNLDVESITC